MKKRLLCLCGLGLLLSASGSFAMPGSLYGMMPLSDHSLGLVDAQLASAPLFTDPYREQAFKTIIALSELKNDWITGILHTANATISYDGAGNFGMQLNHRDVYLDELHTHVSPRGMYTAEVVSSPRDQFH